MIKITVDGIEKEYTPYEALGIAHAIQVAEASLQPRMRAQNSHLSKFINQILSAYGKFREDSLREPK